MTSPRISLARVLELGVRVSWREALAIVHEAVARAGATEGAEVTAESCLLTRGGDVVLAGTAAQARPEAVVRLLDDLLASCSNPGRFADAVANGTALDMIEELSHGTTPKRRRVEVASVAIRGLAAEADAARAMGEAEEQRPSADFDDFIDAPSAIPTLPDQTFALLGDFAFGDAEVRGPGLDEMASVDLRGLATAADAARLMAEADARAIAEAAARTMAEADARAIAEADSRTIAEATAARAMTEADAARAMADTDEQPPSADVDDVIGAPPPAASPTDLSWPSVTALAPPSAIPPIPDQTFALLGDSAFSDAEIRGPGLDEVASVDLRGLATAADAARLMAEAAARTMAEADARAMAEADEQHPSADVDDVIGAPTPAASPTDLPWPSVALRELVAAANAAANAARAMADVDEQHPSADVDDVIGAPPPAASPTHWLWPLVTALAPPSAILLLDDQTVARLADSTVGDAEVRRPGLDEVASVALRELVAAANAARAMADADEQHPSADVDEVIGAPTPAASPTDLPWPSVTALAPPSAIPTIPDQTFALVGNSAFGDAESRRPGLDEVASVALRELVAAANAATDAARERTAPEDAVPAPAIGTSPAQGTRPSVTLRPAWFSMDLPSAKPLVIAVWASASAIVRAASASAIARAAAASAIVRTASASAITRAAAASAVVRAASASAIARAASASAIVRAASASAITRAASASAIARAASVSAIARATYVRGGYPSPFGRVRRASPVALVWSVLAVAAGGILGLQLPETRRSVVEPSEPAIEPPQFGATVGLDGHTPLARPEPAVLREAADPPSVPPLVARSAPQGSPRIEGRRARFTEVPDSYVWSMPRPARRPDTSAKKTATVAGSRSLSTTSAAAASPAPGAAFSGGAPPPAVDPSSVVASPGATASSPAQTLGSASNNVPVNAIARSPDRELEARAIENVLGRYRIAFNELDAGAALAVWPTVNEKTLANAFERLESHDMSFGNCQIEIISVIAEASCSGSARYVPKVGSRTPKTEARRWRFMLRKARGGWLIESVDAR